MIVVTAEKIAPQVRPRQWRTEELEFLNPDADRPTTYSSVPPGQSADGSYCACTTSFIPVR
jgi:hypothetical protein